MKIFVEIAINCFQYIPNKAPSTGLKGVNFRSTSLIFGTFVNKRVNKPKSSHGFSI